MSIAMPTVDEQPGSQGSPPPPLEQHIGPNGRLRVQGLSETDRNFGIAIHISPYAGFIGIGPLALLIPLILWLVRKDRSAFNDDHGKEMVNFLISLIVLTIVLAITIIGIIAIPVLWVAAIVNTIRGAIAAGRGEYFRYPATIRFLS